MYKSHDKLTGKRWLFICLYFPSLLLFLAEFSEAQLVKKNSPEEEKIRLVIQQQLDAFNREDYDTAYLFASRHIRTKFSRPEFELMVKNGYPQIARSLRVMFGEISFPDETHAVAGATITGRDRVTVSANYRMVLEDEKWKVDGVTVLDEQTPVSYSQNAGQSFPPASHSAS